MRKVVVVLQCVSLIAITSGACRRTEKKSVPVAQIQTESQAQPVNQPLTVSGCLRAGEAADTFVLTAVGDDRTQTATYQLVGVNGATLRDHIGERVEVSGVVNQQHEVSTLASGPARQKGKGTSGTAPTVETTTELNIKRMDVSSVRPIGGHCEK